MKTLYKVSLIALFLGFSSEAISQRITIHSNDTSNVANPASQSNDTEYSVGLDVGYFAALGFLPIVTDVEFSDHFSAQLGLGPTFNDGLIALAFNNAWNGSDKINYQLGIGGLGRVKAYIHERDDRIGIWAPYAALGYELTYWRKEWINTNLAINQAYRQSGRTLSVAQALLGLRREYRSGGFVDLTLGISRGIIRNKGRDLRTNETNINTTGATLPAANVIIGFYLN